MAEWRSMRRLLMRTQPSAMTNERTTRRSPARVGPAGPAGCTGGWRGAGAAGAAAGEGWAGRPCGMHGGVAGAERDERGADGGDDQGEPAGRVHALMREDGGSDGEQDG